LDKKLLEEIFQAKTATTINDIIHRLNESQEFSWRLVGDRDNNYGTIGIASDAVSCLVERITNSIDATFEKRALENEDWVKIRSPKEFSEKVIGFKGSNIPENVKTRMREPQDDSGIRVIVHSGDTDEVSTIDVLDNGIGLSRSEIPDTILSLNKGNKIKKWYLMGRFGQGGSTSLKFSEYTIIITKRYDADEIVFTIVRYEPWKEDEKDGKYTYLVKSSDRLPPSISALDSSITLEFNTLVRHINYKLGRQSTPLLSLYGKLDYRLFDPVLPFQCIINNSTKPDVRTVYGSRDRLNRTGLVVQKNEIVVPIEELGQIIIRYWIFGREVSRQQKITFIDPEKPIVITFDGQTHSVLPRRTFTDCKLPYLKDSLVVHVDCDLINVQGRHTIFTSTREALTSEGEELVSNIITKTISNLNELIQLNKEREESYQSTDFSKDLQNMRVKLAEMIRRFSSGTSTINTGLAKNGKHNLDKKPEDIAQIDQEEINSNVDDNILTAPEIPVKRDPPTYIRIRNSSNPLLFRKNKLTRIDIETDAPDYYLLRINKDFNLSKETQNYVAISHRQSDIRNGCIFLYTRLIDEVSPGIKFNFNILLPINNTLFLEDSRQGLVREPLLKRRSENPIHTSLPHIEPVDKRHPYYNANQWNENSVADVKKDNEKVTIYVSMENKWYREVLLRGKYSEVRKNLIQNKYLLLMAFNAYLADKFREQREKEDIEFPDNQVQELFETGSRTILTAITSEKAFETQNDT
jgi:hypothetical protein